MAARKPVRMAVSDLPLAVAYRRSWLTDAQYIEAMESAALSEVASMRLRAQLSKHDPDSYVYLRSPGGAWQVMSAIWPNDLGSVRMATEEERAR
jgi:hypothetical protein